VDGPRVGRRGGSRSGWKACRLPGGWRRLMLRTRLLCWRGGPPRARKGKKKKKTKYDARHCAGPTHDLPDFLRAGPGEGPGWTSGRRESWPRLLGDGTDCPLPGTRFHPGELKQAAALEGGKGRSRRRVPEGIDCAAFGRLFGWLRRKKEGRRCCRNQESRGSQRRDWDLTANFLGGEAPGGF